MTTEIHLTDWGINKVFFFVSSNNASINNIVINYLRSKIVNEVSSIAHEKYITMQCIVCIITLIISDGLEEIKFINFKILIGFSLCQTVSI